MSDESDDQVTRAEDEASGRGGYVGFIDWLNRKLFPVIGPPPVGPYETVVKQVGEAVCPVCGRPMSEHSIDHSTPETILNCPAPHRPQPRDDMPVNEFGMDKPSPEG
jgi:hypothetical protein